MKITEILRLEEMNLFTYRDIAQSVGCSKTTVGDVLARCKECGLKYEAASSMTQDEINRLVYPESFGPKQVKEEPDWEGIHARLQSSRKLNLQYIWENEYRPSHPDGYSYSRFCAKYSGWKNATGKKVVLPQEREPGKELFIDWIGDILPCVTDYDTGEIHEAHFFVTTLGDGSYPFVEAFPDETQLNWNQGHIDALGWYGGIPRIFVPDNCKTAVVHTSLYNPEINHA
jgi:transposase